MENFRVIKYLCFALQHNRNNQSRARQVGMEMALGAPGRQAI